MSAVTATQRELGWNVQILIRDICFAGFYQQDDLATVAQIRRELDLCFVLGDNAWQEALLPVHTAPLVLLDKNNPAAFPTPAPGLRAKYHYILHDPSCHHPAGNHSLTTPCVRPADRPPRRNDDRYLPIGRPSDNPLYKTVPVRGKKRPRTASASPSRSASPTKGGDELCDDDEFPEVIIPREEATVIMSEFRQSVIAAAGAHSRCAISGKGRAWWASGIGPAIQAAHVVPQIHWNTYPVEDQNVAASGDLVALRDAWTRTWHLSNGLLLSTHLHQCFDARILSIDPDTRRIRAFVPYDVITEHHGKEAYLPEHLNLGTLRHHYDLCCIENMAAQKQPGSFALTRSPTTIISPVVVNTAEAAPGDPAKTDQPQDGGRDGREGKGQDPADVPAQKRSVPLSPPSEVDCRPEQRTWRAGGLRLTDPHEVERLRRQGWLLYEVDSEEDSDEESSEEERGRPRKRRCLITD